MGKSVIAPIGLSFKNTIDDIRLYEWINSHSGKSAFIKDVLRKAMEEEERKKDSSIFRSL